MDRKAGSYAHAGQFKRMRRTIKRQRTIIGRLLHEVDCKANVIGAGVRQAMRETFNKSRPTVDQSGQGS